MYYNYIFDVVVSLYKLQTIITTLKTQQDENQFNASKKTNCRLKASKAW